MELANAYFFVSGKIMKENILPTHTQQGTLYSRINAHMKMIEENKNAPSSVQFSRSFVSDSLRPDQSQHTRPLCTLSTPGVYSNSCPSRW